MANDNIIWLLFFQRPASSSAHFQELEGGGSQCRNPGRQEAISSYLRLFWWLMTPKKCLQPKFNFITFSFTINLILLTFPFPKYAAQCTIEKPDTLDSARNLRNSDCFTWISNHLRAITKHSTTEPLKMIWIRIFESLYDKMWGKSFVVCFVTFSNRSSSC